MLKVFRDRNENENNFMLLNITQNILLYILERIMNKNTQVFFFFPSGQTVFKNSHSFVFHVKSPSYFSRITSEYISVNISYSMPGITVHTPGEYFGCVNEYLH